MEELVPLFALNIFGYELHITSSILIQWVLIVITLVLSILYSKKVKKIPGKVQSVIEIGIEFLTNVVEDNMGPGKSSFIPYIGSLGVYLFLLNMVGMFGIKPPTADFSVALGIAITTFLVVNGYTIKKLGLWGYLKGYAAPVPLLLPINIMERIMLPVSLSLRLFGNIFAATMIMELLYEALTGLNFVAAIGLPIPFHFYFDIFDGTIQMIIFVMLTMINIKITAEH
ncbi:MAG: F0F1 ATP synthase subunit A [Clostridium sp.]|uniref:F0F1 ATP synthase subunit A n=1 Tax=Clostridium sp. TaxID=1506 RepID=UPI00303414CC